MTGIEAIEIARSVAVREGWPWEEPILARMERAFFFFGRRRWRVTTRSDHRGGNVNVVVDDDTGRVTSKGFANR